jgi:acetolactate decarboxylase
MKPAFVVLWTAILTAVLTGCSSPMTPVAPKTNGGSAHDVSDDDALVQYSLIAALATGDYAEGASLRKVLADGDFGIGTFDRLDGEMIVLEGQMYQALADGTVRTADLDGTTPFAAVTFFQKDGQMKDVAAATLEDLDKQLDRQLPRHNSPYAIRIDAAFTELTLRSVPAQSPPYQPLVDVVKHQATWQHRDLRGTMIGLRCPSWVGTLNVAGYHWHFLSDDHQIGGHVLACQFREGLLRYDECTTLVIRVPASRAFDDFDADKIKHEDINASLRRRSASTAAISERVKIFVESAPARR